MKAKKEEKLINENEASITTESPEDFQALSLAESGRIYKTTFTKKFEKRKNWERPNPEEIKSFIPGTVEKILVKQGKNVEKDDEVIIYVAMKMRNIIRAPFDGKVESILVKEGDIVPKGKIMMIVKEKQYSPKELKKIQKEMEEIEKKLKKNLEKKLGKKLEIEPKKKVKSRKISILAKPKRKKK